MSLSSRSRGHCDTCHGRHDVAERRRAHRNRSVDGLQCPCKSARTGSMMGAPRGYFVLPPLQKLTLLDPTAPEIDMAATAIVGSIVGYAGKYKELVTETLAKEVYDCKSTP